MSSSSNLPLIVGGVVVLVYLASKANPDLISSIIPKLQPPSSYPVCEPTSNIDRSSRWPFPGTFFTGSWSKLDPVKNSE